MTQHWRRGGGGIQPLPDFEIRIVEVEPNSRPLKDLDWSLYCARYCDACTIQLTVLKTSTCCPRCKTPFNTKEK